MAQHSHKSMNLRDRLAAASSKLHEIGSHDLADAVDEVLAPNACGKLRTSDPAAKRSARNFPMKTTVPERAHIKASAAAVGDELVDRVSEGLRLFVSGEFVPEKPMRASKGTGKAPANLNLRANEQLCSRASARCEEVAAELGWTPTVSGVALAYLKRLYPLPDTDV
ncbi:hypothetical protein AB0D12_20055 [Streptomyces sp. NPDC048479]|uniref:hypothetical protein n=1 Tax=Streptomyces sp. NPDC048479 TaxID=3154725 RepID=UPI00343ECCC3